MKIGVNLNDSLFENTFLYFWVAQTSHPSGSRVFYDFFTSKYCHKEPLNIAEIFNFLTKTFQTAR